MASEIRGQPKLSHVAHGMPSWYVHAAWPEAVLFPTSNAMKVLSLETQWVSTVLTVGAWSPFPVTKTTAQPSIPKPVGAGRPMEGRQARGWL